MLTQSNGRLGNTFRSTVAAYYSPFYSVKIVNDYSGSVVNIYHGLYGAIVFEGGGHAGTNDNSVIVLELGAQTCSFVRKTNPTPLFGAAADSAVQGRNSTASDSTLFDPIWGEYAVDGQPASRHSFGDQTIVGPEYGGAAFGTLRRLVVNSAAVSGTTIGQVPHKVDFNALTGTMAWTRGGSVGVSGPKTPATLAGAPCWSAHVPAQQRIYIETHAATALAPPMWFDLATGRYVTGTGTARSNDASVDGGTMFHVPSRGLLVHIDNGGSPRIRTMDVTVSNPSWNNTPARLSAPIAIDASWSSACWCDDNDRIILGGAVGDATAVYEIEIPASLTSVWTVTRAPFGSGQAIAWSSSNSYKKWSYNRQVRAIVYMPYASPDGDDTVYVYRPRGT